MDTDFFETQLADLFSKQVFDESFVFPDYEGLNLKNIIPQIGSVLGGNSLMPSTMAGDYFAELEGIKKVVLVVFDGLGYKRLIHHIKNHNGTFAEITEKGSLKPMTTVFPSTTSTALSSVFTGLSPAQHQIIGYHMFSKKYGLIFNTLDMKPIYGYSGRVELVSDFAHEIKPLLPILDRKGIKCSVVTKGAIIGSVLSQVTHRGLTPIPYLLGSDMWTHTAETLKQLGPCLSVVYYSGVDTLAHKYGPYTKETTFELTSIEHGLEDFIDGLPNEAREETMLVIVADHGLASINQSVYLKDTPELMQHLMLPPVGDGRAAYLFCKPDERDEFRRYFEKNLVDFKLYLIDSLIERGVFGVPKSISQLKEKLGDFAALSNSDRLLDYPFFEEDRIHPQLGAHGGMSVEEMVVPLLSIKLDKL